MQANNLMSRRSSGRRGPGTVFAFTVLFVIFVLIMLTEREIQHGKSNATLIVAIKCHNAIAALTAIDAGADPNTREGEEAASFPQILRGYWNRLRGHKPAHSNGRPALLLAIDFVQYDRMKRKYVDYGIAPVVQALLKRGADVNARNGNQDTALIQIAAVGNETGVRLLLDYGADVNARNCVGDTALSYASFNIHNRIVRVLLEHGANINAKNNLGWTALMNAVLSVNEEGVHLLLEYGADVQVVSNSGYTALKAALRRRKECSWYPQKIIDLLKQAETRKPLHSYLCPRRPVRTRRTFYLDSSLKSHYRAAYIGALNFFRRQPYLEECRLYNGQRLGIDRKGDSLCRSAVTPGTGGTTTFLWDGTDVLEEKNT